MMNPLKSTPLVGRRAAWNPSLPRLCAVALTLAALLPALVRAADEHAAVEQRLTQCVAYLASDEMEGRGIGTKGLDKAADYIADQFAQLGLNTALVDKSAFQKFPVATSARLGETNRLTLVGPADPKSKKATSIELKLGDDFTPMAIGASGQLDLPLVFVGYGITGKAEKYDDYAGIDVKGKAVVILRHEPEQTNPESAFNGTKTSSHAPLRTKVSNAREHGAAAVLFVTDQFEILRRVRPLHAKWQTAGDKLAEQHARFKPVQKSYEVNRRVSDFPKGEDVSTPEAAYATVSRGLASGWGRADLIRASSAHLGRLLSSAPEEKSDKVPQAKAKEYTGALVKEVRLFRGKHAGVIAEMTGADGKPPRYILSWFVLEGDRWLNEGSGDHDSLEAARAKFSQSSTSLAKLTLDEIESQRKQIDQLAQEVQKLSTQLKDAYDPMLSFTAGGRSRAGDLPVVFCRRAPLDRVLEATLDTDLAALEHQIDEGPTPHSHALGGWKAVGEVEVDRSEVEVKNVIAVLEAEGPLAEETLVIGAHYDHLGVRGSGKEVYNGADDNASGVAAMLEIARTLAHRTEKLRRRVVFIAFSAEERGLVGSRHYVQHPLIPIDKTVAMLNLDCVGRLRDDKLSIGGAGTAPRFDPLLDQLNQRYGFELAKQPSGYGPSDHASFYRKEIPVMHFFTGRHGNLHRPTDDPETLNVPGMRRITEMATEVAVTLANADQRPKYVSVGSPRGRGDPIAALIEGVARALSPRQDGQRPLFGSLPDFSHSGPGYGISGVSKGGPAQRAGLAAGDVIIRLGDTKITNLDDFDRALRKHKAGDQVKVAVQRNGKEQVFEVTLAAPR